MTGLYKNIKYLENKGMQQLVNCPQAECECKPQTNKFTNWTSTCFIVKNKKN